ncbi:MAG TPA: DUF6443 domain-containing protein [Chitinophagaceae bacterium]|nr:DUF6443 domain-containing protein [Chitinophagaceae bacterium]
MQTLLKKYKTCRVKWLVVAVLAFAPVHRLFAQISISGPTCVVANGTSYTYAISGSWTMSTTMTWSITGGVITGTSNTGKSGTPVPSIQVTWNTGISSGSVSLVTSNPNGSASLSASVVQALDGGAISANKNQTINYNTTPGTISCSAAANGSCSPSYSYQWQQSTDAVNYTDISGATGQNLTFSSALTQTTYYKRKVTETTSGTAYSDVATVIVYPQLTSSVSPSSATVNYNTSPGQLTNTRTGGSGTYTYQWQSSPNNSTWTNISGATSQNYTPGVLASTTYYRVNTTSNGVQVTSNVSTITVYPQLVAGIVSPSSLTINYNASGGTLTSTVPTGGNGSYTYQWQKSPDNSTWTNISGATSLTYNTGNLTATTYYRIVATSNGATANSNASTITVYPQITTSISPASASINYNTSPGQLTNTRAGGNGSYTYQWQSSADNSTWTNISGATSQNYTPGNLTATTYYRVATTSNGAIVTSSAATVTVYPQVTTSISPSSLSINYNTSPGLLNNTPGGGTGTYAYQWQSSPNNSTWTNISGATAQDYTPGNLTATTYYRVTTTSNGASATSSAVTVTVYPPVTTSISPASSTINYNTSPGQLTNTPGGGNGSYTYQWQKSTDGGNSWSSISGATSQNYTSGNLTATTLFRVITTSNGAVMYSSAATVNVYPQLQPGSFSSGYLKVAYGINTTLQPSDPSGGNGTYTYQWQSSPNNSTWTNISGATNISYTAPPLTSNQYYRRQVTSNNATAITNAEQLQLPLYGGVISSSKAVVANTTTAFTLTSTQNAGNDACTTYTYQWQSSPDEINWANISSTSISGITATTYYRRQAVCGADTAYSNTIRVRIKISTPSLIKPNGSTAPAAGTQTAIAMPTEYSSVDPNNINYIRTRDFSKPGITDTTTANNQTGIYDVHQVTQYFDGLGRPIETVAMQATPAQHDLVSTNYYDPFGREVQKYLPYSDNSGSGGFRTDAATQQPSFYNTLLNNVEGYYYQNISFEASPLNRVMKTTDAGKSWTGNNVGMSQHIRTNNLFDSVYIWDITYGITDLPTADGMYLPGTLLVTETSDENDNKIVEYKDLEGHVLLKKSQLADAQGVGYNNWLCTYYVYDDLGNLRFVMSPKAVQYLQQNSWVLNSTVADELCFRYSYDQRKRMIAKKVPGAGQVDIVYDAKDRPVMTRDANLLAQSKWMVTVYDTLNRVIKTVLWNNSQTAAYHQGQAYSKTTYPTITGTNTVETETFYDDYTWMGRSDINITGHTYNTSFNNTTDLPVIQTSAYGLTPASASVQLRSIITGTRVRILDPTGGSGGFNTVISWYDDHNRLIQAHARNITGGWDTLTTKYDFSGKVLSTCDAHSISSSKTVVKWNQLTTAMNYDHAGRVLTIKKYLNGSTTAENIAVNTYDELGRLTTKQLGNKPIETLNYGYTIKGWLKGINSTYARTATNTANWFGEDISYDYGFNQNQYNGNIAGIIWKTQGDDSAKAYGFDYDNINRLLKSDFTQQIGSSYSKGTQLDFNVDSLTYDGNGNILLMQQKGVVINASSVIDHLVYAYQQSNTWSNKLASVTDNSANTAPLGDFKDTTATGDDYSYDANGNLTFDNNKHIDNIAYNFLNLPQTMHVNGRGNVNYVYDAAGNKLRKITVDSTGGTVITVTTTYTGAFIYADDTLQYIGHEEGRVRPKKTDPAQGWTVANTQYVYDYYIKDHLGDVRMTLTEEGQTDTYAATMENKYAATENALFDSVASTQYLTPTGFEPTSGADTSNHYVSKLNGNNKRVGPTILLKVMAGDTLTASTYAWYSGTPQTPGSQPSLLNSLGTLLADGVLGATSGKFLASQETAITTAAGPALTSLLNTKDAAYNNAAPKAFLNWALLDERFNYVSGGVTQIPTITTGQNKQVITANLPSVIPKNGYLYVYVSNESPQDVFFDNVTIQHHRGPLLQEDHYYPFGLVQAGISSQAAGKIENKLKFNGKEIQHKEFSTGEGLELFDFKFRFYDQQLGVFHNQDRLADKFSYMSPYQFCSNNPVWLREIDGLEGVKYTSVDEKGNKKTTIEKNVVILLEPEKDSNGKEDKDAEQRNKDKVQTITEELNKFYNGYDGAGTQTKKYGTVVFKFNIKTHADISDADKKKKDRGYEAYRQITVASENVIPGTSPNGAANFAPAAVITTDKTGYSQGSQRGNVIYTNGEMDGAGAFAHEALHALGVGDNDYTSGGLRNNPPQFINKDEINLVIKEALDGDKK